ncbi:pilus assembly protein TadG-related protein [Ornithinimicrobium murale]|uniref:pilus assembly protein TadG-related protein n=1 Tax=Ornithinimicrobium murale TaxID=1050153 RepID=UPI000E0D5C46|nr:pilus assembly protein TadG-related protein [Ornithinimicrobium murale]
MTTRLKTWAARNGERGTVSIMVAIISVALLLMVTLVYDGATKLRASRDATSIATEAARAAAQELTGEAILGHQAPLHTSRSAAAAHSYLAMVGANGTVSVSGTNVTVTVTTGWEPTFAGLFTNGTVTGSATVSSVRAIGGVEQ